MSSPAAADPDLAQFSRDIGPLNLMPLWERTTPMQPGGPCVPELWRYAELRPLLMRASRLITKKAAERRVLVLENPSLKGTTYVTNSLYAGLQVILPGEVAAAHRHSPSALRFIVEGTGAYTDVGGERIFMEPGDFIVTPNWAWHDHGNTGNEPVVWLDGLDTPFARFFGAQFREDYPDGAAPGLPPPELPPVNGGKGASPLLRYPYDRTRAALDRLARDQPPHPAHGARLRYANAADGKFPFPTMAVFMQLLPPGFAGRSYRGTDGTVFAVAEGEGSVEAGGKKFSFAPHDVFVVPPWCPYRLAAARETVLFSYSDRAGQEALGFWRESLE